MGTAAGRDGFTIVELIVAIVVLTIGLIASASVIGSVTRRQMHTTSRTEMMTAADSKLEHLRVIAASRSADTMQLVVGGSITTPTAPYADVVSTPEGKQYRRLWRVTAGPVGTRSVTLRIVPLVPSRNDQKKLDFTSLLLIL